MPDEHQGGLHGARARARAGKGRVGARESLMRLVVISAFAMHKGSAALSP